MWKVSQRPAVTGNECRPGIRYHPGLSMILAGRTSVLSSATALSSADSVAAILSRAYQLARARLASPASAGLSTVLCRPGGSLGAGIIRGRVAIQTIWACTPSAKDPVSYAAPWL